MTLCVIDGKQCDCQPDIRMYCDRIEKLRSELREEVQAKIFAKEELTRAEQRIEEYIEANAVARALHESQAARIAQLEGENAELRGKLSVRPRPSE